MPDLREAFEVFNRIATPEMLDIELTDEMRAVFRTALESARTSGGNAAGLGAIEGEESRPSVVDFTALDAEVADHGGFSLPLDDFAHHNLREAYAQTASGWHQFYDPNILTPDTEYVFQLMMSRVAETPAEGPPLADNDPRRRASSPPASADMRAGLPKRQPVAASVAKSLRGSGKATASQRRRAAREAWHHETSDPPLSGERARARLACAALVHVAGSRDVGSTPLPGGTIRHRSHGHLVSAAHPADLAYAYSFGIALRHVERQCASRMPPSSGNSRAAS